MSEADKAEEILVSLTKYIEERKRMLEEDNIRLLAEGRREFKAAIAERLASYERPESPEVWPDALTGRKKRSILSDLIGALRRRLLKSPGPSND